MESQMLGQYLQVKSIKWILCKCHLSPKVSKGQNDHIIIIIIFINIFYYSWYDIELSSVVQSENATYLSLIKR